MVLLINCIAIHAAQRELTQEERNLKEKFRHTTIVPLKFISDYGADDGDLAMLQIRPLYTLTTKNWNFINRPIIPIIDINGVVGGRPELPSGGGGNARGLGDISYTLAAEARQLKPVSIAAGLATTFPTATDDALGSGKWSLGPAVVVMTRQQQWSAMIQARQVWSVAGDAARANVNNLAIEPILMRKLTKQWYLISDPIITANWELQQGDRWMVPLGGGSGCHFSCWKQHMDFRLEAYYNVIKPGSAPNWSLSATVSFIFQPGETQ